MRKRGRLRVALGAQFFAYSTLIIGFKGVPMKLIKLYFSININFFRYDGCSVMFVIFYGNNFPVRG